ncbi:aminoglycoside nucleotidyltransferase [Dictyobacter alpinus]|uniref:Aminoglycoside nucleotidyltransferase n=1 Tax=Dictyobacter alpinus TaxID=2014873 RepID=A0A402BGQ7_9CHLR|nr:amino acid transporter [Dictyobacter alpinus]GCE30526.1 aminoglycoside nucleotidyltransferase [Dictyobacter alpinus]
MMYAHDVLTVLTMLKTAGVSVWLDGGWGIDALVGKQTREHMDVDVVVLLTQADLAHGTLEKAGYRITEDEFPTRFVMQDEAGHSIDFHPIFIDEQGDGVQQLQDSSLFHYPVNCFEGTGIIDGQAVPCIDAEAQILCHSGYEPAEKDRHDLGLLGSHFQLELPPHYQS